MTTLTLTPRTPGSLTMTAPYPLSAISVYNVKDYGAKGDGTTDDYAAITAAYTAIPSTGGILYFPAGTYRLASALSFTNAKPFLILGAGKFDSIIAPSFAAGDAITVNGPTQFDMRDIGVVPSVNRTSGTYNLHVLNCTRPTVANVYMNNGTGGLFMFESGNFLQMVNVQGDSTDGPTAGDTCLRLKSHGGTVSNCIFRTGPTSGTGYSSSKPCLYVTGTATSLNISNCEFAGGGPKSAWTISGIASDAAKFTVTTSATHDFAAGDFVAIHGSSVAGYNNAWRVATVPSGTTFTVTSTANSGAATGGTAESLTACALVSNEDGAVNESLISNCLFSATQTNLYGSVGLYFDGRRGTPGARPAISGWNVDGNYYDFGTVGLMLSGTAANASNEPSVFGFSVSGGKFESTRSAIHVEGVPGVTISGVVGNSNQTPTTDRIAVDAGGTPRSCEIYINAGSAAPYTQGVTITGSNLGMVANWQQLDEARSKDWGIFLDGCANLQDVSVTGCNIYGHSLSINYDAAPAAAARFVFQNNILTFGGTIGGNAVPSIASAGVMNLYPFHETLKVTGTTNINTISPAWTGKRIELLFSGALSLVTGGNLAIGANRSILAGDMVTLVFDGTSWYVR